MKASNAGNAPAPNKKPKAKMRYNTSRRIRRLFRSFKPSKIINVFLLYPSCLRRFTSPALAEKGSSHEYEKKPYPPACADIRSDGGGACFKKGGRYAAGHRECLFRGCAVGADDFLRRRLFVQKREDSFSGADCARVCFLIECSQLYHAPWIDDIRAVPLGGLILGYGFCGAIYWLMCSAFPQVPRAKSCFANEKDSRNAVFWGIFTHFDFESFYSLKQT